ncbi:MAG: hypothetical protein ACYC1E_12580 [Propionibacteriaceae bacterium]
MPVPALDAAVTGLQERLGSAIVAVDIWDSASALTVSGLHSRAATGPSLGRLAEDMRDAAALAGSELGDHLVLTVHGGSVVVVTTGTVTAAVHLTDEVGPGQLVTGVVETVRAALGAC